MADLSVTAASVLPVTAAPNPSKIAQGTGGGTVTQGTPVYLDATDNKWKAAQNDTAVHAGSGGLGIAMSSWADGQPASVLVGGDWTVGATLTVGETYIVSNNAGKIAPVADISTHFVSILGVAISATVCRMPQGGPIVGGIAHA